MPAPTEMILTRLQADPFFLATVLGCYARSRNLDDHALADALGCAVADLEELRLCRAPRSDPVGFRSDVSRIARRFGLDPQQLADVFRRGQSLLVLQQHPPVHRGRLLAAREAIDEGKTDP